MKFQFEFYYYKLAAKVMTAKTNKILGKQRENYLPIILCYCVVTNPWFLNIESRDNQINID